MRIIHNLATISLILFLLGGCLDEEKIENESNNYGQGFNAGTSANDTSFAKTGNINSNSYLTSYDSEKNNSSTLVANAGLNTDVIVNSYLTLDGSGSYGPDGVPISLVWSITLMPENSRAKLSNAYIVNPSFFADVAGVYVVNLVVSDGIQQSVDFVIIDVWINSANLFWDEPQNNSDDVAGYKIYYGKESGHYYGSKSVGNILNGKIFNLPAAIYYFAVASYDRAGNESKLSNEVSKLIF